MCSKCQYLVPIVFVLMSILCSGLMISIDFCRPQKVKSSRYLLLMFYKCITSIHVLLACSISLTCIRENCIFYTNVKTLLHFFHFDRHLWTQSKIHFNKRRCLHNVYLYVKMVSKYLSAIQIEQHVTVPKNMLSVSLPVVTIHARVHHCLLLYIFLTVFSNFHINTFHSYS